MEELDANRVMIVRDPRAAVLLREPATLSQLSPFIDQELTVTEVARMLDVPVSTQYRRVQRFLQLGLLEVSGTIRRIGKPLKLYRSAARSFFIPHAVAEGPETWSGQWNRYWDEEFDKGMLEAWSDWYPNWGHQVWRDEAGVLNVGLARRPFELVDPLASASPAILSASHDALYLNFEDAKAMQSELDAIWRKYASLGGSQRYLARIQLVPARGGARTIR
ncbi:MAG TPA: hypothetical protein VF168_02385 [Trueperaceae bacterium]